MRSAVLMCLLLAPWLAWARADPLTGARPGNVIGTGQSLPRSDKASNATPGDTSSIIAPRLPTPSVGDDAQPAGFLRAAERAITLGRTGEAQEALERAESRLLDRAVPPSRAGQPSRQPLVAIVADARQALAAGDRQGALGRIAQALHGLTGG